MKKISVKGLIAAVVLTALISVAGVGTYARYIFGAKSDNNVVRAASFEVGLGNADQMKSARFSLVKFNPFSEPVEYPITINKNKTEVPVKYELSVKIDETNKGLFEGESPIKMELLRKVGSEYKVVVQDFLHDAYTLNDLHYDANLKPVATEEFKVRCSWVTKSDEIDTTYQGKTGKFDVIFNAEQTKDAIENPYVPEINIRQSQTTYFEMPEKLSFNKPITLKNIKYYKDKDGKRVVELGNIVLNDTNNRPMVTLNNLVVVETAKNSKEYKLSCETNDCDWNGKLFNYRVNRGLSANMIFEDKENTKNNFWFYKVNDNDFINWFE